MWTFGNHCCYFTLAVSTNNSLVLCVQWTQVTIELSNIAWIQSDYHSAWWLSALRRVIMIVTSAGVVSCWYQVLRAHLAVSGLQSASDTQSVDSRNK